MPLVIFNSVDDFLKYKGSDIGVSEWLLVDQNMINRFAEATLDYQWIHIDLQKTKNETDLGATIAHGYLLPSLIPHFLDQVFSVTNLDKLVNYGIEKMVFKSPVPVNSRLRLRAKLDSAKDLGNICLANIRCVFEIEEQDVPVAEGNIKFLYYFK